MTQGFQPGARHLKRERESVKNIHTCCHTDTLGLFRRNIRLSYGNMCRRSPARNQAVIRQHSGAPRGVAPRELNYRPGTREFPPPCGHTVTLPLMPMQNGCHTDTLRQDAKGSVDFIRQHWIASSRRSRSRGVIAYHTRRARNSKSRGMINLSECFQY
jgi:hypothetical protein